jgi:hypothetical protein
VTSDVDLVTRHVCERAAEDDEDRWPTGAVLQAAFTARKTTDFVSLIRVVAWCLEFGDIEASEAARRILASLEPHVKVALSAA